VCIDVEPDDWRDLDWFWDAHTDWQISQDSTSACLSPSGEISDSWDGIETWWQTHFPNETDEISPHVSGMQQVAKEWSEIRTFSHTQTVSSWLLSEPDSFCFDQSQFAACWSDFDPWWDAYAETGHETAIQIEDLLERSNSVWNESAAPFDTDPLSSKLSEPSGLRGPLRPSGEVSWSRWLARLLRPSQALVSELFGMSIDHPPTKVDRETRVEKPDGTFRRPDILVFCGDRGLSIEVKLDDENYRKTAETARLVEQKYDGVEWDHALLLPKEKSKRLTSIVEPEVQHQSDGSQQIMWDDPEPINVVHWQDVTAAIRTVLRQGKAVNDQWAANGYLFCAVAEQRLVGFQPLPIIERSIKSDDFAEAVRPLGMMDTLEEQLTYLTERLNQ